MTSMKSIDELSIILFHVHEWIIKFIFSWPCMVFITIVNMYSLHYLHSVERIHINGGLSTHKSRQYTMEIPWEFIYYSNVIMSAMASQITGVSMVYSTFCWGADQRKHQSSASLTFVRGIHRWPVDSPHKWSVTRKMFSLDDAIVNMALLQPTGTSIPIASLHPPQ